ncbi:methyltransferase domain-containing protein [uncultured Pseudoteredinibacter sp.]|uniref:methyltransferase domain-containing protein n=1 Tax=uncultured Pseudoteredinibacter sp. TaxID=1641701 RepID=UPI00260FD8DF|nr:methyltransferase domain-containing protein [uncultured Pseudoteredinibacter sp.]
MSLVEQCRQWLHQRANVPQSPKAFAEDISRWSNTPLGEAILSEEQASIDELLRYRFGYHLCAFSHIHGCELMEESRINHKIQMVQLDGLKESLDSQSLSEKGLCEEASALPFDGSRIPLATDSVDVLLLHHCLEFSSNPHELLREAQRVLIDHGHLIITSFNPLSIYGLFANVARFFKGNQVWRRRFLTASSSRDWLQLLGLQPLELIPHFYRLPLSNSALLERSRVLEGLGKKLGALNWGASYTLVARNDVFAANALKPRWQKPANAEQFGSAAIGRQAKKEKLKLVINKGKPSAPTTE